MSKVINTRGIFFVEAPFHLFGVLESIKEYELKKYSIYIRLSGNDKQLINLVEKFFPNNKNIKYFTLANKKNSTFISYFTTLRILLFMSIWHFKYKYIFLGNFESKFLNLFKYFVPKSKIVLLDDGVKAFVIQNKFTVENNYNMFTMLHTIKPFVSQTIKYHKFEYLKFLYKINNKNIKSNEILFLGSKLCEEGILKEEPYIDIIKTILEKFALYKITYIPHRGENISKLKKILLQYNNFEIKEIDYPVEVYLLEENIIPSKVISFYSAALLSIKLLYENVEVNSILFDYSDSIYKYNIDLAYQGLEEYDIKALQGVSFV